MFGVGFGQAARHSTPVRGGTGVEDAEGLDTEHVSEAGTGGKRTNETFNKEKTNETEMNAEKCATQIPFTLSQCGVPTLEKCSAA